jgi:hypothetical protein
MRHDPGLHEGPPCGIKSNWRERGNRLSTVVRDRAEPTDVSQIVLALLTAEAVTGETVVIDGGRAITY